MKNVILSLILSILFTTANSQTAKDEFCRNFTNNAQQSTGFIKSHFDHDGSRFIQVMDIGEMAGDTGHKYDLIVKEASDPEYRNLMAKQIIKEYKHYGVVDLLIENGFTHFQVNLLKKDGNKMISEVYKL